MQLREAEQLLLFHIYHATRMTKAVFAKPSVDLISLMDRYEAGGGLVDAALNELWMGNVRITSFQNDNDESVFKITSSGIREVEDALASPTSVLMRALEKYCPDRLKLLKELGVGDSIPASDRVVTLNHNSQPYKEAVESIDKAIEAVRTTNDLGAATPDERDAVVAELSAARRLLEATKVRAKQLLSLAASAFEFIAKTFTQEGVKRAAAAAWDLIKSLLSSAN